MDDEHELERDPELVPVPDDWFLTREEAEHDPTVDLHERLEEPRRWPRRLQGRPGGQ